MLCFPPTGNRCAKIQLGKLAVGGFHKPKQTDTLAPNAHFQRRITDCSIVFQINKYVNLAITLNTCKHIMAFLCFSIVKHLHTAPLTKKHLHKFYIHTTRCQCKSKTSQCNKQKILYDPGNWHSIIWDNKLYTVQSWAQCRPTMTSLPTIQNKITLLNRNCTNRAPSIHKIKSLPNQSIYLIVGQINSIFHPHLA